jgi:ketohexokinase
MRILSVGIAVLDIVNRVRVYPAEDSEVRALAQSIRLGGNAANTAVVLAQLGVQASWTGNLPARAAIAEQEFARFGVDIGLAKRLDGASMPTSYITLSDANGSRTVVHFRDLPEYDAAAFARLDLRAFDWIHFEGRAVSELAAMVPHARATVGVGLSLEVEKPRPGIEALFPDVDLLMFSRDYALSAGHDSAAGLLRRLPAPARATCTWGAEGAWCIDRDGRITHAAAPPVARVVDTIGAGDVFNAGLLQAVNAGSGLAAALNAGVDLASHHCARQGRDLGRRGRTHSTEAPPESMS